MPLTLLSSLASRLSLTPRRGLFVGLALLPAVLAAVLIGLLLFVTPSRSPGPPPGGNAQGATALPPPGGLLVEVVGAVAHPGVYRIARGERASAAIAAAGGITRDADPSRLPNLAARLQDGEQIRVLARTAPARSSGTGAPSIEPVSLNDATAEELAAIPGFTPELVAAVIRYRTEYGGFSSTRELVDILQMSETEYILARRYVSV